MNFVEAESYLFSLGNEVETMKLGLENIRRLLAALGDPQNNYLKVQVAGTNGKGSVCAFLNSICLEANIKTGLFTSPHLVSITERVVINGVEIVRDEFARIATRVRETAEQLVASGKLANTPTFFEQVTAIALVAFTDAKVELAILETGLGGRLDATTAANAEIAAITRIDFDHQEYLGETIEQIAVEKAAIIREGSRVVIGEQIAGAEKVIRDRCSQFSINAKVTTQVRTTCVSGLLNFETDQSNYRVEKLGLLGRHQSENAKVAILLAAELKLNFSITTEHIIRGLENTRHSGRLEYHGRYLFDGAHNVGGAKALRDYLDEFETRPITIVFGVMRDKCVAKLAEILFPVADSIILTSCSNERAMSPEEILKNTDRELWRRKPVSVASIDEIFHISSHSSSYDNVILVTGSLYLVGEAKKILNN